MSERVAAGWLIADFLWSIEIYLTTYTAGKFNLSFAAFGPTGLRRLLIALLLSIGLLQAVLAPAAVFTTKLQASAAIAWDQYVERFERSRFAARAMLDTGDENPTLIDLNPSGKNAGDDVPNGYLHHWVGAIRIPNTHVASVRNVLEDYDHYPQVYPDVKLASASKIAGSAGVVYEVRLITEQVQGIGLHFAFDMRLCVSFSASDDLTLIESRSYRIRESNSGRAPYTDLLPEGQDHGIVWRLNSYWRLRQTGSSVYAECQVISLSRKPLFGMRDLIQNRAQDSLGATLRRTRDRALISR